MKRSLLFVFFSLLFIIAVEQTIVNTNPAPRNAVLEEITGIN
jgi:hypothetical protein